MNSSYDHTRVLVAFDGSVHSQEAIEQLLEIGLPTENLSVRILTVAHADEPPVQPIWTTSIDGSMHSDPEPQYPYNPEAALTRANFLAAGAADHLVRLLLERHLQGEYHWHVESAALLGDPADVIVANAMAWQADLIVMGSRGNTGISRLFLGSVSHQVLKEAPCSVHLAKRPFEHHPLVVALAIDKSDYSRAAVHEIIHRRFPIDTHIHIVTAVDASLLAGLGYVIESEAEAAAWTQEGTELSAMMQSVRGELERTYRNVTSALKVGSVDSVIEDEIGRVQADLVFMGTRGLHGLKGMLIGSVARTVSEHIAASVEVIRSPILENVAERDTWIETAG